VPGYRTPGGSLFAYNLLHHDSSDSVLPVLAAFGVRLPSAKFDENWSAEGLTKLRDRVEAYKIKLGYVPLPLSSSFISKSETPNMMLGKGTGIPFCYLCSPRPWIESTFTASPSRDPDMDACISPSLSGLSDPL